MNRLHKNKVFTFLLAGYLLMLMLAPCVDKIQVCQDVQHVFPARPDSGTHPDCNDSCSPFCACTCCSLAMEITSYGPVPEGSCLAGILVFSFSPRHISLFSANIWEPPKA